MNEDPETYAEKTIISAYYFFSLRCFAAKAISDEGKDESGKGCKSEKMLDPDGITTEFIRCPDPTDAGVVAKVTRKKLETPKKVGWS